MTCYRIHNACSYVIMEHSSRKLNRKLLGSGCFLRGPQCCGAVTKISTVNTTLCLWCTESERDHHRTMQSLNSVWSVFFFISWNQRGLKAWYRATEAPARAAPISRGRWRNLWRKAGWRSRGPSWRTGNRATLCSEGTFWRTTKTTERAPCRWEIKEGLFDICRYFASPFNSICIF